MTLSTIIPIETTYITLGQFVKLVGAIDTGGQVKWFLSEHEIKVNNELENRRGRKLYPGDKIEIETAGNFEVGLNS
jgi:ribosome-associated protein